MNDESTNRNAGLFDVIRFFLRHFLLLFGMSFAFAILFYSASRFMTPVYRAETLLAPAEDTSAGSVSALLSRFGGLGRLAGLRGPGPTRKDEALAMLRSRAFVSTFITEKNGLAVMYPDSWNSDAGTWSKTLDSIPSEQDVYVRFANSIMSVSENQDSGLVTVAIHLPDRFKAADWANAVVRLLNDKYRQFIAAEAQRSIEYLHSELDKASSVELRQVIHRLIEAQIQTIMLTNVRKDFVFRVIDPAIAPDDDRYVRPRHLLSAFIGLIFGGFMGLVIALVLETRRAAARAGAADGE